MTPYNEISEENKDGLKDLLIHSDVEDSDYNAEIIYNNIDKELRFNIHYWGASETVTRDLLYVWIKENRDKFNK